MSGVERERPGHDDDEPTTPSGEPEPKDDDRDPTGDPVTGSTEEDPSVEDTGLPPAGRDPMAGESPSS